ncbi:hypothetical protein EIK77_005755 [Talaromyces pinophilus]|jgi:hypothetical protein|nr:hypothetical protein EIK77_005755 [Talaromyces pinophilus]
MEICILTNLISSVPPILPAYSASENNAPLFRNILDGLVSRLPQAAANLNNTNTNNNSSNEITTPNSNNSENKTGPFSSLRDVVTMYAPLSAAHLEALTLETVHAITAIGGHENPPSRHIIGQEGVAAVKEKLKTVSEELEDFVQSSYSVNIHESTVEEEFSGDIM